MSEFVTMEDLWNDMPSAERAALEHEAKLLASAPQLNGSSAQGEAWGASSLVHSGVEDISS